MGCWPDASVGTRWLCGTGEVLASVRVCGLAAAAACAGSARGLGIAGGDGAGVDINSSVLFRLKTAKKAFMPSADTGRNSIGLTSGVAGGAEAAGRAGRGVARNTG